MPFEVTTPGPAVLLTVTEKLDASLCGAVRDAVLSNVDLGTATVYIDLGATDFVDSAGLGMLVGLKASCKKHKAELVLLRPKPEVMRTLEMMMMHRVLDIVPEGPDASQKIRSLKPQ